MIYPKSSQWRDRTRVTTNEDVKTTIDVLANDSSLVGDQLRLTEIADQPSQGEAVVEGGMVVYQPSPNFSGIDSLKYVVSGNVLSATAPVYMVVLPVNDPPIAVDDDFFVDETIALGKVQADLDVLANDSDPDGDRLSVLTITQPKNGTAEIAPAGALVIYTPGDNFVGADSLTYTIQDGNGGLDVAKIRISVSATDDPPVAVDDAYFGPEDQLMTRGTPGVLENDFDEEGQVLEAILKRTTSNGVLLLLDDGSFTYQPDLNFAGTDTFMYAAFDQTSESNIASVILTIRDANDAPVGVEKIRIP